MSIGMEKKMINIRVPVELLDQAKKIAEKNKKKYEHPNSVSGVVLTAFVEYLVKQGKTK
jgi:hypothetical protein